MTLSNPARVLTTMACALLIQSFAAPRNATAQTDVQLERAVHDALDGERDLRRLEVDVQGKEVTLRGQLPHFWAKDQAIKRTLSVTGVERVVSEIEIPESEDDNDLAEEVAKAVTRYPHYTIWDHIEGRINEGVVTLSGKVTPDRDKAADIYERVAKIRGVQAVESDIMTLPPAQGDRQLRRAIGARVFSSEHFERYASQPNPPFHIVVHNGIVTLVGYVQTQIEMIELQRIVAQTQGVLRVENQIQRLR